MVLVSRSDPSTRLAAAGDRSVTMASALMAWVWIGFTLAQLNNVESHLNAHGRFSGQDELFDADEQLFAAAPEDWTDRHFLAPVWNFLQGEDPLLTLTPCYLHVKKNRHKLKSTLSEFFFFLIKLYFH